MNSLRRELEVGEVVVLKKKLFKPEYHDLKERLVEILGGGFGMHAFTAGTSIYVKFLSDGEESRFKGTDIDPEETKKYQRELKQT